MVQTYIGRELRGKPFWKEIISLRAKNSELLASRKIEFNLKTLPNLLLTRFHAELLNDMNKFLIKVGDVQSSFLENWRKLRSYHEEFLISEPWSSFLQESMEINFENLELLEKIRRRAKGEVNEIVTLCEGYIADKKFLTDYGKMFDTALKPLSKIYELWCLKKLCEILEIDPRNVRELPCKLPFELQDKKSVLYYNIGEGLKEYSGIMRKIEGVGIGRPDFLIISDKKIVCIMDAKCKTELGTEDMQRILSYLLDYMYPAQNKMVALIFYLTRIHDNIKQIKVKDCNIYLIPMRPTTYEQYKQIEGEIKTIINDLVKNL
ncbi:MAG: hypothetical protein QXK55_00930 [Nitrososphaeria archaeon]